MSYIKTDLRNTLKVLAEKLLPAGSGSKILQIDLILERKPRAYIRITFYRPRAYMLVSYKFSTNMEYVHDSKGFTVTAYHDSAWRYDGFSFLREILKREDEIEIKNFEILDAEYANMDDKEEFFSFNLK